MVTLRSAHVKSLAQSLSPVSSRVLSEVVSPVGEGRASLWSHHSQLPGFGRVAFTFGATFPHPQPRKVRSLHHEDAASTL